MDYVKKLNDVLPGCIRVVGAVPNPGSDNLAFSVKSTEGHAVMSTFVVKIVPAEFNMVCMPGALDDANGVIDAAMQIKYYAAGKAREAFEG